MSDTEKGSIIKSAVVKFAGDSGDGMQVVGELFADNCAATGNEVMTFPDFPSEIRAPAGSLPGVSGFQINFGSEHILTSGDRPNSLVAMNPAALKVNLDALEPGGFLLINSGAFSDTNLKKAAYEESPLNSDEFISKYTPIIVNFSELINEALSESPLKQAQKNRCKNFIALGTLLRVYSKELSSTIDWINDKWKSSPDVSDANIKALTVGYSVGENSSTTLPKFVFEKAEHADGLYRKINGNEAVAIGLVAAAENSFRNVVLGSYPITPATPILEYLAKYKNFNVKSFQAEDEIAAVCVAIGASFAGSIGVTTTSGPGLCLKSEALGLAVITELPLVVVNVMRAGPSTGLPTKTEQGDLLQAIYGRNGESPMVVLAATSPQDCFDASYEAVRIALKYRTPVMLLTDSYIANSSAAWAIPSAADLPDISVDPIQFGEKYIPYKRDEKTLARQLAIPGRPGFEHRIGGLEKTEEGVVSYDALNHEKMVRLRAEKIKRVTKDIPALKIDGPSKGKLLVIGWGSTYGAITNALKNVRSAGKEISAVNLRYLNPLPADLGDIINNFDEVIVPEGNLGQLALILRAEYLKDVKTFGKIQGNTFTIAELTEKFLTFL